MLTFLFWNIQKKPLLDRVARLATRHAVDVVMLAECDADPPAVLAALGAGWAYPPSLPAKVQLYTRLSPAAVVSVFDAAGGLMSVRQVSSDGGTPFLLAAVHFHSKASGWTDASQLSRIQPHSADLERVEDERGITRTVLVGDLNMDPFAPGVIGGLGLHVMMTRELAVRRNRRTADHEQCRRTFFNPMWQFLADRPGRPSGTYYRHDTDTVNHYWHALDQVLVRPELADKLMSVDVLDHDGIHPLTRPDGGWPDTDRGSDHLPLLFTLDV